MNQRFEKYLEPGEEILMSRGLHPSMLLLPAVFLIAGLIQFTPLRFVHDSTLPGLVFIGYGLVSGWIFFSQLQNGGVCLTSRRLLQLSKVPGKQALLESWKLDDLDSIVAKKGIFGSLLDYGHMLLIQSGKVTSVVRSVSGISSIAKKIQELLGQDSK